MISETLTCSRDPKLTVDVGVDGSVTVLYDRNPIAMTVLPQLADGSDPYYLAGHDNAGSAAIEADEFLVATWTAGGEYQVLHTAPQSDTVA